MNLAQSSALLATATQTIDDAIGGMEALKLSLNTSDTFEKVLKCILNMKGRLILSGMGKSGYIAKKIAASFASTGTASLFVHPAEASHGDLGMISEEDVIILLSNSGETSELRDIINYAKRFDIKLIAITMKAESTLAKVADYALLIPLMSEASYLGAPTTSALMMLALGDALMVAISQAKGITKDNYKLYHPGGKIGASLLKVEDLMHKGNEIPFASVNTPMSEVLLIMTKSGFGCAIVVDENKKLLGLITDGDLRRHMNDHIISKTAKEIMSNNPKKIQQGHLATEALNIMNSKSITSLIICGEGNIVEGILHIHDLLRAGV